MLQLHVLDGRLVQTGASLVANCGLAEFYFFFAM